MRRRLLKLAVAMLVATLVLFVAGSIYLASLPGVGDAELRVTRILASHHATASGLPSPPRLSAAIVAIEDQHFYSNFIINILSEVAPATCARAVGCHRRDHGSPSERRLPSAAAAAEIVAVYLRR